MSAFEIACDTDQLAPTFVHVLPKLKLIVPCKYLTLIILCAHVPLLGMYLKQLI